jgi:hypothetical protein
MREIQCSRCHLVIYGDRAGHQLADRDSSCEHTLCWRCWNLQQRRIVRNHPHVQPTPYRFALRHVRRSIRLPEAIVDDYTIGNAEIRVYAELHQRGADRVWVAATVAELAEALGLTRNTVYKALHRLQPRYVELRPGTTPAWYIGRRLATVA